MTQHRGSRSPRTAEWLRGAPRLGSGTEPKFFWLLGALLVLIAGRVVIHRPLVQHIVYSASVATVGLATIPLLPPRGLVRRAQLVFATLAVGFVWLGPTWRGAAMHSAGFLGLVAFFVSVAFWTVWHLMRAERVTAETLIGALCGYLLAGLAFGLLFSTIETVAPGSLRLGAAATGQTGSDIVYFSFITLMTIGYGDIVPVGEAARLLVMVEGVTGQFYIAAVVARLISLRVTKPRDRGDG